MKKAIFYVSIIISLIILVNIIQILATDLERLTEYGYGYLIGKIILFGVFLTLTLFSKKYILRNKKTE